MPGYADFSDVQARSGRFATLFDVAGQHPNQADVEVLLGDVSAEIDIAITARGYNPAGLDVTVKRALRDVAAYGALARALRGVQGEELDDLREYAQAIWGSAMGDPTSNTAAGQRGSISAGTFPAIAALEAGEGGEGGQSAGSFWDDEPAFGTPAQVAAELAATPAELAPTWAKSQPL